MVRSSSYRTLKMCSQCCESREGGSFPTGMHMDSLSHRNRLQWLLGAFCSPANASSVTLKRGLRGTCPPHPADVAAREVSISGRGTTSTQGRGIRGTQAAKALPASSSCSSGSSWDLGSPCLPNEGEGYVKPAASAFPSVFPLDQLSSSDGFSAPL